MPGNCIFLRIGFESDHMLQQNSNRYKPRPADKISFGRIARTRRAVLAREGRIIFKHRSGLSIYLHYIFQMISCDLVGQCKFAVFVQSAQYHIVCRRPNTAVPVSAVFSKPRMICRQSRNPMGTFEFLFVFQMRHKPVYPFFRYSLSHQRPICTDMLHHV